MPSPVIADETHNIALKAGYNLITLPVTPNDTSIASVLSPIISKVQDVWELDPSDTGNPWKRYRPGLEDYSDLTQMTTGKGYWIKVSSAVTLQITGQPILSNTIIYLKQGWNIIGWPYQNTESIITALSGLAFGTDYNQVSRFNSTTGAQENFMNQPASDDFSSLEPNKAYYIRMLQDRVIVMGANGYFVDTTPPTGTISINNGDTYTNTTAVVLYLTAEDNPGGIGVSEMRFSNYPTTNWSYAQSYKPTAQWSIRMSSGTNTVYAKFSDLLGNWSEAVSDTIILDTSAPTAVIVTDEGAYTTHNTQLYASWTQSTDTISGVKEYLYAIGTSSGGTDIVDWTSAGLNTEITHAGLSLQRGVVYYFSVKAVDNAGNEGPVSSSDGITYSRPPEITDIILNSTGNEYHQGSPILIQAVATDPDGETIEYRYSAGDTVIQDWTTSSQISWIPTAGYFGQKAIKVEVKNQTETGNFYQKQVYIFRAPVDAE